MERIVLYVEKGATKHFEEVCRENGMNFKRGKRHKGFKQPLISYEVDAGNIVVGCGDTPCKDCKHEFNSPECRDIRGRRSRRK